VKLVEDDEVVVLVVGDEVLDDLLEILGAHVVFAIGLDHIQSITWDEAMHGSDYDKVVQDPYRIGRSNNKRVLDMAEKTMVTENGAQVDVPLGQVVGLKVENDWRRRRTHRSSKGIWEASKRLNFFSSSF
jgi:hypothetical protein